MLITAKLLSGFDAVFAPLSLNFAMPRANSSTTQTVIAAADIRMFFLVLWLFKITPVRVLQIPTIQQSFVSSAECVVMKYSVLPGL